MSAARGIDEFVVRDHFAEDAVRIVVVVDRSRSMALFPDWLPWLDKQAAVREVGRMIVASGAVTNALIGFAAVDGREARVVPAGAIGPSGAQSSSGSRPARPTARRTASTGRSSFCPARPRTVPPGTFVFVLSDFLPPRARPG